MTGILPDRFSVRMIRRSEWKDAMALCWRVFLEFESDLYPKEGTRSFYRFVSDERLYTVWMNGGYPVCAAFTGDAMIGVAAVRNGCHLSLLFVEGFFQGKGVGRALVSYMQDYVLKTNDGPGYEKMTVNASPVAIGFYHHLGFRDTAPQQAKEGILYTPMEVRIS